MKMNTEAAGLLDSATFCFAASEGPIDITSDTLRRHREGRKSASVCN